MTSTGTDIKPIDTSNEKWVRAINWKASIPALIATIAFVLSLDAGPSCNFIILKSPLLQRDQHFGPWYFLTTERVAPSYEIKDVCRLYQSSADLGTMWEAARMLWFISIVPCFILTFTLWRMLITPISKSTWGVLIATCFLCCTLQTITILLFLYGHACYGNQMMRQPGTTCTLTTGSYIAISASCMWVFTLLTMGYFPPYLKHKNPKHNDNHDDIGIVSTRNNGLIELQVCDGNFNSNSTSSPSKQLDMEMAKTEINQSKTEEQPPEIDGDSFNKFIRKAEIDVSVSSGNKVESSDSSSIGSKQRRRSSNTIKNLEGSEVGMDVSLDKSQKSITKLEERFA